MRHFFNEHDQLWVLDVDGVNWCVDAFWLAKTTDDELASLRQLVEGVQIQPH